MEYGVRVVARFRFKKNSQFVPFSVLIFESGDNQHIRSAIGSAIVAFKFLSADSRNLIQYIQLSY